MEMIYLKSTQKTVHIKSLSGIIVFKCSLLFIGFMQLLVPYGSVVKSCVDTFNKQRILCLFQSYDKDGKSTRLNSSHANISYAVFCLKKKQSLFPLASLLDFTTKSSNPPCSHYPFFFPCTSPPSPTSLLLRPLSSSRSPISTSSLPCL